MQMADKTECPLHLPFITYVCDPTCSDNPNSALIKEKLYAGEAIVATAFGIIFGPHCANLINPRNWGNPSFDDITLEFTRIVLALSVFAVGVELPR